MVMATATVSVGAMATEDGVSGGKWTSTNVSSSHSHIRMRVQFTSNGFIIGLYDEFIL